VLVVILSEAKNLWLFLEHHMSQANSQRCFALRNMTDEGNRFNASSLQ